MKETQIRSLGREDPLEKEMATHSSTLAWKIAWMEEPGRLPSMGRLSSFTFPFNVAVTHSPFGIALCISDNSEFSHKAYEVVMITMITLPRKKLVCEKVK